MMQAPIYEIVTGSSTQPILINQLKAWYYISQTITHEDERLSYCIGSAIENFELSANLKIAKQTLKWMPWRFGNQDDSEAQGRIMRVPFGKTANVEIKYDDTDGLERTFSDTEWNLIGAENTNSMIALTADAEWPTDVQEDYPYPIRITFDCGWPIGDSWEATTAYVSGDIMIPTFQNRMARNMAYECAVGGTSGGSEPTLTTTIGNTGTDGTVTWECIGQTVPYDIFVACLCMGAQRMRQAGITLERDPNYNILAMNFDHVVTQRMLHW